MILDACVCLSGITSAPFRIDLAILGAHFIDRFDGLKSSKFNDSRLKPEFSKKNVSGAEEKKQKDMLEKWAKNNEQIFSAPAVIPGKNDKYLGYDSPMRGALYHHGMLTLALFLLSNTHLYKHIEAG